MSKTGRAVVYPAPNEPFEVREYPVRDARAGEVLVRISMSTICRSDIHSYEGHRPNPCPGILGHEIIGIIEQIGAGVGHDLRGDPLAVGDRITWTEYFADGPSYYRDVHDMPQKAPGLRKYGHDLVDDDPHFLGGFADYCYILPGTGILKLPGRAERRGGDPAQLWRRHDDLGHRGSRSRGRRNGGGAGSRAAGALRLRHCQGQGRAPGHRTGRGARSAAGRRAVRGRPHLRCERDGRGRPGRGGPRRIAAGRARTW